MDHHDPNQSVNLRMIICEHSTDGETASPGNLLARVSLGAAVAFVECQPVGEQWRFTADLGSRVLTADDMERIWQTPEFWGWVAAHN